MSIHKRIVVILLGLLVLASIFYCIMFLNTNTLFAEANELTRRERLNASGKNKWTAGVICRILNNQTYMGVMAYGKSYCFSVCFGLVKLNGERHKRREVIAWVKSKILLLLNLIFKERG